MARSSRSYDQDSVKKADAKARAQRESTAGQRESTAGPAHPDSMPTGPASRGAVDHASAVGGLDLANDMSAPQRPSRGRARQPNGKYSRPGYGGYSVIDGSWVNERRCDILHNDWPGQPPVANDWSQGSSIAENMAARWGHPCPGDERCKICAPAAFFNQIEEFGQ